jgi:hypothetical protein
MARQPAEQPAKAPPKDQRAPQTTASEDRLAETQQDSQENLEEQAKSEQSQRDEELGASKQSRLEKAAAKVQPAEGGTPAGARAGHHARADTQGGFMDQMSVRSHADALEGHFVTIDLQAKGVQDAYKDALLIRDADHARGEFNHQGNYGVYVEPLLRDPETGIPVTAAVRLRDETNALVRVPYEALSRSEPRGR